MTHKSAEIIKKGFKTLCRISKNKTNKKKKKKKRKYPEKIQKDIAEGTPETRTTKEFY